MIMAWFAARMVPIGAGLALVVALVVFDKVRIRSAENRGAEKVIAKVERNNTQLTAKAGSAGRKSLDPASKGPVSPYYRD